MKNRRILAIYTIWRDLFVLNKEQINRAVKLIIIIMQRITVSHLTNLGTPQPIIHHKDALQVQMYQHYAFILDANRLLTIYDLKTGLNIL